MTLQDLLRERTRNVKDLLEHASKEVEDFQRQESAARSESSLAEEGMDELRTTAESCRMRLTSVQAEVSKVENRIAGLRELLKRKRDGRDQARSECDRAQKTLDDKSKSRAAALRDAEQWKSKIEETREAIERHLQKLEQARHGALTAYLDEVWRRLMKLSAEAEDAKDGFRALAELQLARNEDPHVAELMESREEWQRILQSAGPPRVSQTAREQLEAIEEELDHRFPHALLAQGWGGAVSELEELFFLDSEKTLRIPLPFPARVLQSLDAGKTDAEADLAVRMIWGLTQTFVRSTTAFRISSTREMPVFEVEDTDHRLEQGDPTVLDLAGGGKVSFLFSTFPAELQQVIRNEDSNQ